MGKIRGNYRPALYRNPAPLGNEMLRGNASDIICGRCLRIMYNDGTRRHCGPCGYAIDNGNFNLFSMRKANP